MNASKTLGIGNDTTTEVVEEDDLGFFEDEAKAQAALEAEDAALAAQQAAETALNDNKPKIHYRRNYQTYVEIEAEDVWRYESSSIRIVSSPDELMASLDLEENKVRNTTNCQYWRKDYYGNGLIGPKPMPKSGTIDTHKQSYDDFDEACKVCKQINKAVSVDWYSVQSDARLKDIPKYTAIGHESAAGIVFLWRGEYQMRVYPDTKHIKNRQAPIIRPAVTPNSAAHYVHMYGFFSKLEGEVQRALRRLPYIACIEYFHHTSGYGQTCEKLSNSTTLLIKLIGQKAFLKTVGAEIHALLVAWNTYKRKPQLTAVKNVAIAPFIKRLYQWDSLQGNKRPKKQPKKQNKRTTCRTASTPT